MKIDISSGAFFIKLFLIAIIFILISNFLWLLNNYSIEDSYSQEGLFFSVQILNRMQDIIEDYSLDIWHKIFEITKFLRMPVEHSIKVWPQFTCFTTSLFYMFFGRSLFIAKLSMWPYLIILLITVFFIGKHLSSVLTGVISTFLVFMYPLIFEASRQYNAYFPVTAFVALSILMLIKCYYFSNSKYSFILGVVVGIGMLIKGQILFFVGIPILYVIFNSIICSEIKQDNPRAEKYLIIQKKKIANMIIFATLSFSISCFWWGNKLHAVLCYLKMHVLDPYKWRLWGFTGECRYSLSSISWYIRDMYLSSMGPVLFIFFLPSLFKIANKVKFDKGIFLLWLIIPILIFSLAVAIKYPDYLMPVYPAVATLTGWWIANIRSKRLRASILSLIALYSVIQFYFLTFGSKELRGGIEGKNKLFGGTILGGTRNKIDYGIDKVIVFIKKNIRKDNEGKINVLSVDLSNKGPRNLEILFLLMLKDNDIKAIDFTTFPGHVLKNLENMDFVVFKMSLEDIALNWPPKQQLLKILKDNVEPIRYEFITNRPTWDKSLDNFYNSYNKFELISKIYTTLDYGWVIFKKLLP